MTTNPQGNKICDCDFHQGRTQERVDRNEQARETVWVPIAAFVVVVVCIKIGAYLGAWLVATVAGWLT